MGRFLIRAFGIAAAIAAIMVFAFGPDEERSDRVIGEATDTAVDEAADPTETADDASRLDAPARTDASETVADGAGDTERRAASGTRGNPGAATPQGAAADAADARSTGAERTTADKAGTGVGTTPVSDGTARASATSADSLTNGDAATPRIDMLRIEPDGLTLLSGLTAPDADVQVALGPDLVAEGRSGPDGSFVLYGKVPRSAMSGPLEVRSINPDGGIRLGVQTFIVEPPRPTNDADGDTVTRAPTPPTGSPNERGAIGAAAPSPDTRWAAAPRGARSTDGSDGTPGATDTSTSKGRDPDTLDLTANVGHAASESVEEVSSDAGMPNETTPSTTPPAEPENRADAVTAAVDSTHTSNRPTRGPTDPDGQADDIAAENGSTPNRRTADAQAPTVAAENGAYSDQPIAAAPGADAQPSSGARGAETGVSPPVGVDLSRADIADAPRLTRPGTPPAVDTGEFTNTETADAELALDATGPSPARQAPRFEAPRVLRLEEGGLSVVQGGPTAPLSIDSISYAASGSTVLGGRASGDADVRVYIDNAPIDATRSGPDGQWRLDLPRLEERVYTLRVDQIAGDGTVIARAETPFKPEDAVTLDTLAATDANGIRRVTVQPGFTLWAIAERNYGDGLAYVKVFEANASDIRDPDLIYPGQIFDVPR